MLTAILILLIYTLAFALVIGLIGAIGGKLVAKTNNPNASEIFGWIVLLLWVMLLIWFLFKLIPIVAHLPSI